MTSFTERQEGPDGQFCELLTRFDYERVQRIEEASVTRKNISAFADTVLREAAWEFMVRDALEGKENTSDIGVGDPVVIAPWRDRAVELYLAWQQMAFPKDASTKGRRRSATSARRSSSS